MHTRHRDAPQKRHDYRASRAASLTPCLTCLRSLDTENAFRPGKSPDPREITSVSHLIENGVDPLFVQQQVGHSWASTTAVYTQVGADAKNRMLRAALDAAFGAESSPK